MAVSADEFWEKFKKEVLAAKPFGYGGSWSAGMYDALHRVQTGLKLWCQCKSHPVATRNGRNGERMGIDFTWYPNGNNEWVAPLVAIEHENLWTDQARNVDHWKVNQIAAPLRVFIGYVSKEADVQGVANELMKRESEWNAVSGDTAEGMIILGHDGMAHGDFAAWACRQGDATSWRRLA